MSNQNTQSPRYQLAHSLRFYGKYDILDTYTGVREAISTTNVRMINLELSSLNNSTIIK